MADNVQTLFDEGKCYACYGPITQVQILRLVLLSRIAKNNNPTMDTSPQTLLDQGACLACYGMSLADIMELTLLGLIANNGGGGGSSVIGCILTDSGSPVGAITPQCPVGAQLYYDVSGAALWVSVGATNVDWVQLI